MQFLKRGHSHKKVPQRTQPPPAAPHGTDRTPGEHTGFTGTFSLTPALTETAGKQGAAALVKRTRQSPPVPKSSPVPNQTARRTDTSTCSRGDDALFFPPVNVAPRWPYPSHMACA